MKRLGCPPDGTELGIFAIELLLSRLSVRYGIGLGLIELVCLLPQSSQVVVAYPEVTNKFLEFGLVPGDGDALTEATYSILESFILTVSKVTQRIGVGILTRWHSAMSSSKQQSSACRLSIAERISSTTSLQTS